MNEEQTTKAKLEGMETELANIAKDVKRMEERQNKQEKVRTAMLLFSPVGHDNSIKSLHIVLSAFAFFFFYFLGGSGGAFVRFSDNTYVPGTGSCGLCMQLIHAV